MNQEIKDEWEAIATEYIVKRLKKSLQIEVEQGNVRSGMVTTQRVAVGYHTVKIMDDGTIKIHIRI